MFYVDVNDLLDDFDVKETLSCKLRPTFLETDEYGNPLEDSDIIEVECGIVEAQENVFDVRTNSYLVNTVYHLYIPYDKYHKIDFDGAEFKYRNMIIQVTGLPLKHSYASHFVVKAVQKKVSDVRQPK